MPKKASEFKRSDDLAEYMNELAEKFGDPTRVKIPWKSSRASLEAEYAELVSRYRAQPKEGTIRKFALDLLCEVDYYEDKTKPSNGENFVTSDHPQARSVGYTYAAIIDKILDEFPKAGTSVACLRWYAVKIRGEEFGYQGFKLAQRRPRSAKVKASVLDM